MSFPSKRDFDVCPGVVVGRDGKRYLPLRSGWRRVDSSNSIVPRVRRSKKARLRDRRAAGA